MDLRTLPEGLTPTDRCDARRTRIETELDLSLDALVVDGTRLGNAEEKNCEQMFGHVPLPVGLAGPLTFTLSTGKNTTVHLPLATTEGALVASVNRGCKALSRSGVRTSSVLRGISRSLSFRILAKGVRSFSEEIQLTEATWKGIAERTSSHLRITEYEVDVANEHLFLTLFADTGDAMGMNMITIAAQAVGEWMQSQYPTLLRFVTVAGNVDSDKKPSSRTADRGRGIIAEATAVIDRKTCMELLKTSPESMHEVAVAKLEIGSVVAGTISANMHAANVIAALYLATGQDAAHVVEGSLTETTVHAEGDILAIKVRLPAVLVGVLGGGTALPAQKQCLDMLLKHQPESGLSKRIYLAECIAAAVLAGELSLLAAQASHTLAKAHKKMAR